MPVAYDTSDTQATFTLDDGTAGAVSYDIPWGSVDPTQASQSLSLSNFNLNIAGQNLSEATATFTTLPTVQFANGVLTGITFAVNTAGLANFPYTSLSMTGLNVAAQTVGGQTLNVLAEKRQTALVVDFSTYVSQLGRLTP